MTFVLGILLKIIVGIILLILLITGIVVPIILGKWFTDDLNGYYEAERERKREEFYEKQRAKLKAYRDEEKRRKGIPIK